MTKSVDVHLSCVKSDIFKKSNLTFLLFRAVFLSSQIYFTIYLNFTWNQSSSRTLMITNT